MQVSMAATSDIPFKAEEGFSTHYHFQWTGTAALVVLKALQKHGGSIGHFITDAIRFYWWYMCATDKHSIVIVPHGKISSTMQCEMDKIGAQTLELHS